MNRFTKFLYAFIMVVVFTLSTAFSQCPNGTYLNIVINPDQYPGETSWALLNGNLDTIVTGGPYTDIIDYLFPLSSTAFISCLNFLSFFRFVLRFLVNAWSFLRLISWHEVCELLLGH